MHRIAATHCRRRSTSTARFLAFCLAGLVCSGMVLVHADEWESGQVQVELVPGVPISVINDLYGTTTLDSLPPLYLLQCPHGAEDDFVYELRHDPNVVDADYAWDNETPEGTRQMMVAAVGGTVSDYLDQHVTQRIHLAEIQEHTRGDGIIVAVIDTGVLAGHPALDGMIDPDGYDFVDNDTDPLDSTNGYDDDADGTVDEGAGHGTMVAGIVHLVAPGARILPIRVLDDEGQGTTFNVAKGIRYAVEHGAQVINLSLGLARPCMVLAHEIEAAYAQSIAIVGAAGNGGSDYPVYYPAAAPQVISVAALDSVDVRTGFTTFGPTVDVAAPGDGILAPYHDGEYAIGAGTSFAAPFIAGQCALVYSLNPSAVLGTVYGTVTLGVVGIYQIPENAPYEGQLGSGRFDGLSTWTTVPKSADVSTAVVDARVELFPNPAVAGERIMLRMADAGSAGARLLIVDPAGRRVRMLDAGPTGLAQWDGRDASGRSVPPGVYFVRAAGGTIRGRIVLSR